jgi:hypothetical protein
MTDLSLARLAPYWFTPTTNNEGGVRFKLKPLTERQKIELADTLTDEGMATPATFYLAGEMAIEGGREIDKLTVDGQPATWALKAHREIIPNEWVAECGIDVYKRAYIGEDAEKN